MRINIVTQPVLEPITVQQADAHLRLETTSDDTLVAGLISAARKLCEAQSHLCFITQTWDFFLDDWGTNRLTSSFWGGNYGGNYSGASLTGATIYSGSTRGNQITLPHGPIQSVTSVKYNDTSGTLQTWDSANYIVSAGNPGRIAPKQGVPWPILASQIDCVQIRYVAGYGTATSSVPEVAKCAIKLVLDRLYEVRGAVSPENLSEVPITVSDLLNTLTVGNQLFC